MSTPRTWLIGMNNPYGPEERYALYPEPKNSAGDRLCRVILGLHKSVYLSHFHRRNTMVGRKWDRKLAKAGALGLFSEIPMGHTVVLLGKEVWVAWSGLVFPGTSWEPFLVLDGPLDRKFVLFPHPSGLCRYWNEPGAYSQARQSLVVASPELKDVVPQ